MNITPTDDPVTDSHSHSQSQPAVKYNIVYNPNTNRGGSKEALVQLVSLFEKHDMHYALHRTTAPSDATTIAKTLAQAGETKLVVAGGDGTLYEALNGVSETMDIAIIPVGTGNDVAKTLGIPLNVAGAFELIKNQQLRSIDYAQITGGVKSLSLISYGITSSVLSDMRSYKTNRALNYYRALLTNMFGFKAPTYTVRMGDKERSVAADFLTVHNCKYAGGGMELCTPAVIDDGQLNLLIVQYRNKFRRILNLIALLRGTLYKQPNVKILPVERVSISSPNDNICSIDGELVPLSYVDVQVVSGGLRVYAPS